MNRREAKREACFRAAMGLESILEGGWEELDRYGGDRAKVEQALGEIVQELLRRGWRQS